MTSEDFKALRNRHDLTQLEVAEAFGVHKQTVWRWESDPAIELPPMAWYALVGLLSSKK